MLLVKANQGQEADGIRMAEDAQVFAQEIQVALRLTGHGVAPAQDGAQRSAQGMKALRRAFHAWRAIPFQALSRPHHPGQMTHRSDMGHQRFIREEMNEQIASQRSCRGQPAGRPQESSQGQHPGQCRQYAIHPAFPADGYRRCSKQQRHPIVGVPLTQPQKRIYQLRAPGAILPQRFDPPAAPGQGILRRLRIPEYGMELLLPHPAGRMVHGGEYCVHVQVLPGNIVHAAVLFSCYGLPPVLHRIHVRGHCRRLFHPQCGATQRSLALPALAVNAIDDASCQQHKEQHAFAHGLFPLHVRCYAGK